MPRLLWTATAAAVVLVLLGTAPPSRAETLDPAPLRQLDTSVQDIGFAVSPSTGLIYVASNHTISVYPDGATGSTPSLTSYTDACNLGPLAINAAGTELLVACPGQFNYPLRYPLDPTGALGAEESGGFSPADDSVAYTPNGDVIEPSFYDGSVYVWHELGSSSTSLVESLRANPAIHAPEGAVEGPDGSIYVASDDHISQFAPGATGSQPPVRTLQLPLGADSCYALTTDSSGNLYAGCLLGGVLLYPPGVTLPTKEINGAASFGTGASGVTQVALDAERDVIVARRVDGGAGSVTTFAPLAPLQPPGSVAGLKVAGKKTDRKRTVTWSAASPGTSPITAYDVTLTQGHKTFIRTTTSATKLKVKVAKLRKSGRYTVSVVAVNAVGTGPAASATLKVEVAKRHRHHAPR